ncbi:Abi-alpha family protein [Aliivibrio fischeri]|uniref:DUF4393 domain-containing protein n=1 Tax=Aliivibrio fischeri TaxID=668 RepID=A0A844P7Z3_ALIFS|nr:Abi-alpha family protein [Aliivibrio fischeri]MUK51501.1 DUF4393 domain-containing protein [Aliivibrio fischeri]
MNELLDAVKSAPKVIEKAYSDGVSDTLQEASKIGVDAVKTIRLALFPMQFTAMAQDRLSRYISRAMMAVPEDDRISPPESLILPIADRLKYQEEENPLTDVYLNLLSRAMDKERIGEAHPAFINIINQLSPDEVLLLNQIGKKEYFLLIKLDGLVEAYSPVAVSNYVESLDLNGSIKSLIIKHAFVRDSIAQPELLPTFLEHIASLGLAIYDVRFLEEGEFKQLKDKIKYPYNYIQRMHFTKFGELFFQACINCEKFA